MEWGDKIEFLQSLVPQYAVQGKRVKALDEYPQLDTESAFYMDAFSVLSRGRPTGVNGMGGIPFADIECFARRAEINSSVAFERFLRVILALDDAYLSKIAKDNLPRKSQGHADAFANRSSGH